MRTGRNGYEPSKWSVAFDGAGELAPGWELPRRKGRQPAQAPVPEVATVKVSMEPVALTIELPGRTSAYRVAETRSQVNGLILKRLFTEGSRVRAGQALYPISPAPFQAVLDNAKAAVAKAEANLAAVRIEEPEGSRNCFPKRRSAGRITTMRRRP